MDLSRRSRRQIWFGFVVGFALAGCRTPLPDGPITARFRSAISRRFTARVEATADVAAALPVGASVVAAKEHLTAEGFVVQAMRTRDAVTFARAPTAFVAEKNLRINLATSYDLRLYVGHQDGRVKTIYAFAVLQHL